MLDQSDPRHFHTRPWGHFQTPAFLPGVGSMKLLTLNPEHRLSLQRHKARVEHWVALSGSVVAEVDDTEVFLSRGQHIQVPCGSWHRLRNDSKEEVALVAEVQVSAYETARLAEDDIERRQDDYGRS